MYGYIKNSLADVECVSITLGVALKKLKYDSQSKKEENEQRGVQFFFWWHSLAADATICKVFGDYFTKHERFLLVQVVFCSQLVKSRSR